jgi:DNA-binding transcriptional ArsR family regulator
MVKSSARLDDTFAALADPTRRQILVTLAEGDHSVGELAAPFDMSLPAISKHLTVLERAGLITRESEGRVRRCRLEPAPLAGALEWIAQYGRFWEDRFDSLERLLAERRDEAR